MGSHSELTHDGERPDVAADVASETIAAVIGDLAHARAAIPGWTPQSRAAVAVMVGTLAGELADLARALQAPA